MTGYSCCPDVACWVDQHLLALNAFSLFEPSLFTTFLKLCKNLQYLLILYIFPHHFFFRESKIMFGQDLHATVLDFGRTIQALVPSNRTACHLSHKLHTAQERCEGFGHFEKYRPFSRHL